MGEQLVGRQQELAAIDVFLDEDGDGAAASLILEGEAGMNSPEATGYPTTRASSRMEERRRVVAATLLRLAG